MDPERLAAYLAGELDADETADLRAALVRDPRLRADLDAMRRADEALGTLSPTELPAGFEARLRAAVDRELAGVLRPDEATGSDAAGAPREQRTDDLAHRRDRRARRSWVPVFAGAAAAVAVVAGVAIGVGGLGGVGDDDAATDTAMTLESLDDAGDAEMADDDAGLAPPAPGEGPTVIAGDRDLDDDLADELLASVELQAIAERGLDAADGRSLGAAWRDALTDLAPTDVDGVATEEAEPESAAGPADAPAEDTPAEDQASDADEDTSGEMRAFTDDPPVRLLGDGALEADDLAAADRCLTEVLGASADAIPAYLELASHDGEPAVVIGLVTLDPATGAYSRSEVWVLAREDCQVRRFAQS